MVSLRDQNQQFRRKYVTHKHGFCICFYFPSFCDDKAVQLYHICAKKLFSTETNYSLCVGIRHIRVENWDSETRRCDIIFEWQSNFQVSVESYPGVILQRAL